MKSECLNIRGLNVWYKKRQARYKRHEFACTQSFCSGVDWSKWSWEDNLAKSFK